MLLTLGAVSEVNVQKVKRSDEELVSILLFVARQMTKMSGR